MKHTPGPWEVQIECGDPGLPRSQGGGEKIYVGTKDLRLVHIKRVSAPKYGEQNDIPLPVVKANAALIAAAPELLYALRLCKEAIFEAPMTREGGYALKYADKAIAKAEGRL